MSNEIDRMLDAARDVAPGIDEATLRAVVKSVLLTVDDLIEEVADGAWPDVGDLALLSNQLNP